MAGRIQVTLIVRDRGEQGYAGYLLRIYGGNLACFVTIRTRAEAGPEWRQLTQNLPDPAISWE